jgi:hypothetical protein
VVRKAKRINVTVIRIIPPGSTSEGPQIGGDHIISCCGKWKHDFPPAEGEFRKTMEKQDAGPTLCLEPGLQNMHRETIDVVDNAGTDSSRKCAVAIGR